MYVIYVIQIFKTLLEIFIECFENTQKKQLWFGIPLTNPQVGVQFDLL